MTTCTHYKPTTADGGFCRINAYGVGVMVGASVCRVCPSYSGPPRGIGDITRDLLHPFAVAFGSDCLDENNNVKPKSPCGEKISVMNEALPL